MEWTVTQEKKGGGKVVSALFLAAAAAMILATVGAWELLPWGLVGAVLVLLPGEERKALTYGSLAVLALWLAIRFRPILNGLALLANRLFEKSEAAQAYVYTYFAVEGGSAGETVAFLSLLLGWLCRRWGNRMTLGLCLVWAGAMAYFGVTPGPWILAAVLLCGALTALPGGQRLLGGLLAGLLVVAIAGACMKLAPEPIPGISKFEEGLRDKLAFQSAAMEQTPVPSQVPEPEILPPDQVEQEQPDHGVQGRLVNVLFLVLVALTLAVLFVPAVIRDRAAKKAERNRAGLRAEDPAEAIRAMYLYAMRWRDLEPVPEPVPEEVYQVWQEAAFSGHPMGEDQRQLVHDYMERTAGTVWDRAGRRRRLEIRYRLCL